MLSFDDTGLSVPSTADIREEVRALFVSAFTRDGLPALDTAPETPAGQLSDSNTAIIADKNAEILHLANMFNPLTAEGIWQAALGQIYFLSPNPATPSTATCTCTGRAGTVIAAGSLIQSSADDTQWAATENVTIPSGGTVSVTFQCQTAGQVSAAAGTLDRIVTTTPGWDTVTNAQPATVGTLAESQLAFEKRRYQSVAINARGSIAALYSALAALDGVVDLAIIENDTDAAVTKNGVSIPGHSLWIAIVGGDDEAIAAAIYRNKDAGCGTAGNTSISYTDASLPLQPSYTYTIERPDALQFGVTVTIRETDTTPADVETLIKNAVYANFYGGSTFSRAGTAQTIYASRFYGDVIATGANGLVSVQIAAPVSGGSWTTQVTVNADKEPSLDMANITVAKLTA